jgi:hypothetical protein
VDVGGVNLVVDRRLDENSVCGARNLACCAFLRGVDVGGGDLVLDRRFNENSVCGMRILAFLCRLAGCGCWWCEFGFGQKIR